MPTGYTAPVQSGEVTEFPDFAMRCARAMGVAITMRDDPLDKPIPDEFQPSSFYRDSVAEAEERLATIEAWTAEEAAAEALAAHESELKRRREYREKEAIERDRYESMLAKVEAWDPPTHEHEGLKEFMVSQLEESIRFDCSTLYAEEDDPTAPTDPIEYRRQQISLAEQSLDRYRDEWRKEQDRASGRTRWVQDLRDSLTPETADA